MYKEIIVKDWDIAKNIFGNNYLWIFRGQEDSSWVLETTIERTAKLFNCCNENLPNRELHILRQFQKRAHHHISSPPLMDDLIEWLSIIQHHGGPTRLLDFTRSFYIAMFFAIEKAKNDSAVWAINIFDLKGKIKEQFGKWEKTDTIDDINEKHIKLAEKYIKTDKKTKSILFLEPIRLPERLSIQQGLFLMPCDISSCFMDNLYSVYDTSNEIENSPIILDSTSSFDISDFQSNILKIIIKRDIHKTAIDDLKRMNITSSSLFPGLDGFARSLSYHLRIDEKSYRSNYLIF